MPKTIVLIIGSGRSGTTWLQEYLTAHPLIRPVFEPLHPGQLHCARGFSELYLTRHDIKPDLRAYLQRVQFGRTDEAWIRWLHMGISRGTPLPRQILQYIYNAHRIRFWARRRVIKFIHANLMIEWLSENFHQPIVYIVRNPYDVINSQTRTGWGSGLETYLSQRPLVQDYLWPYRAILSQLNSFSERSAAIWAIQNLVALDQVWRSRGRVVCVSYEALQSRKNLHALMERLGYSGCDIATCDNVHRLFEKVRSSRRRSRRAGGVPEHSTREIARVLTSFGIRSYEEFLERLPGEPAELLVPS